MERSLFEYDNILKMVVIGDHGVGKTTLVSGLVKSISERIKKPDPTIGVEFSSVSIFVKQIKKVIKFQIWDTAGQEQFKSITKNYYRNAQCAIVVFDITRRESFDNIKEWIEEVRHHMNDDYLNNIFIVGNKSDKKISRKVSIEEAVEFANSFELDYSEASGFVDKCEDLHNKIIVPLATDIFSTLVKKDKKIKSLEIDKTNSPIRMYGYKLSNKCCA